MSISTWSNKRFGGRGGAGDHRPDRGCSPPPNRHQEAAVKICRTWCSRASASSGSRGSSGCWRSMVKLLTAAALRPPMERVPMDQRGPEQLAGPEPRAANQKRKNGGASDQPTFPSAVRAGPGPAGKPAIDRATSAAHRKAVFRQDAENGHQVGRRTRPPSAASKRAGAPVRVIALVAETLFSGATASAEIQSMITPASVQNVIGDAGSAAAIAGPGRRASQAARPSSGCRCPTSCWSAVLPSADRTGRELLYDSVTVAPRAIHRSSRERVGTESCWLAARACIVHRASAWSQADNIRRQERTARVEPPGPPATIQGEQGTAAGQVGTQGLDLPGLGSSAGCSAPGAGQSVPRCTPRAA